MFLYICYFLNFYLQNVTNKILSNLDISNTNWLPQYIFTLAHFLHYSLPFSLSNFLCFSPTDPKLTYLSLSIYPKTLEFWTLFLPLPYFCFLLSSLFIVNKSESLLPFSLFHFPLTPQQLIKHEFDELEERKRVLVLEKSILQDLNR